jgi:hypothetical protein
MHLASASRTQPLRLIAGESKRWIFTVVDLDGRRSDLSSASAIEFQVKKADGDPDPALVAKALGTGITLLDQTSAATRGQFQVDLGSSDTALAAGTYRYDVVVVVSGRRHFVVEPSDFKVIAAVNLP